MKQNTKRLLIATDAWYPQVNGVVRTLDHMTTELRGFGHEVKILSPEGKKTFSLPSYPEIQLAYFSQREIRQIVEGFSPNCIHIATEGPIGFAVRRFCLRNGLAFTTGFHTKFSEYAHARIPLPGVEQTAYSILRWFHGPSKAVLAPTPTITKELLARGITNAVTWTRGVNHALFKNYGQAADHSHEKPVLVYVGRIAVEKGIEDFLSIDHPGTKLVIGDGPLKASLERKYPEAVFTGYLFGEELARTISSGDVFVFPSKTDTFGLVMLEAMACGLPVAAFPVTGPIDVVDHGNSGWLDDDLGIAVREALKLNRGDAIAYASNFTWGNTARVFLANLYDVSRGGPLHELEALETG